MSKTERVQRLLANAQKHIEGAGYNPNSATASIPWNRSVEGSRDLDRILAIPRRVWTPEEMQDLSDLLTPLLKKEGGTQTLRPVQAVSLHDLGVEKGLVCTARVGAGKTLILLLASYIVKAMRPLILVPANLRDKTIRDLRMYRKHWEIAEFVRIESYEILSRKEHAKLLENYRPDFIGCDEAHHLKNTRAAATKRLKRYLSELNPNTILALLSGTLTNRSLKDFWHLLRWTLPHEKCPLPHNYDELDMWSAAVDEKIGVMNRVQPGELLRLCNDVERKLPPLQAARAAIRRRLVETSGIVTTPETFQGSALEIEAIQFEPPEPLKHMFRLMRKDWETPDGWPIPDGVMMSKYSKELALGFYYRWNPRPPEEWLKRRKEWCKACRKILSHNQRNLDTESQVIEAVKEGLYPKHETALAEWEEVEDTFKITTQPVWIDDFAIDKAIEWAQKHTGIVWVRHRAFGKRLAEKSGLVYYENEGYNADGDKYIEDHPADQSMIASIASNREGKNLQHWNKNLVVDPMSTGKWWEQLIGRTHREGQKESTVFVYIFYVILDHLASFYRAMGDAEFVEGTTGQVQKLLYANLSVPSMEDVEELWEAIPLPDDEEAEEREES